MSSIDKKQYFKNRIEKLKKQLGEDKYKELYNNKMKEYRKTKKNNKPIIINNELSPKLINILSIINSNLENKMKEELIKLLFYNNNNIEISKNIENTENINITENIINDDIFIKCDDEDNNNDIENIINDDNNNNLPFINNNNIKMPSENTIKTYFNNFKRIYNSLFENEFNEEQTEQLFNIIKSNPNKDPNIKITNIKDFKYFKKINQFINEIDNKYTNIKTRNNYYGSVHALLSYFGDYFKKEYDILLNLMVEYNKLYEDKRGENTTDKDLLEVDDDSIKKLIESIEDPLHKAFIAVNVIIPRRGGDYRLCRITYNDNVNKLDKIYNYLYINKNIPTTFYYFNFKTSDSSPVDNLPINKYLSKILAEYIKDSNLIEGDFIFGTKNYKFPYVQSSYSHLFKKIFLFYTNKNIGINELRYSHATKIHDNTNLSVNQKKQIAQNMGHSLKEQALYSKHKKII